MKCSNKNTGIVEIISDWTTYFETLYKPNYDEHNFDEEITSFLSDNSISHDNDVPFTCKDVRNGTSKLKIK